MNSNNFPPLDEFLCFATYTANLAFHKAYKPYLGELGLTYTQWITLIAISEADNLTVGELGEKLFLASNTLTPLLKGLEKSGFVARTRSPADERKVVVTLTEHGRAVLAQSQSCANIFGQMGLTPDEAHALQKAMTKLRDNLLA